MRIKITRMLGDVDPSCRPEVGEEYEVIKVLRGLYNPQTNKAYRISVNGRTVTMLASECVVTKGTVR